MNKHPTLSIAVIHDQRAGHLNPSLGIVDSLEKAYTTTLQKIITPSIKKWQISLLKKLSWYPHLFDFCSAIFFKNFQSKQNIDCIICSGMPNLLYGIFVSRRLKVPLFYAGDLRKVNDAVQSILLGAVENGFGGCIIANIDKKKLSEELNLDERYEIALVLALGYPKEEVVIENINESGDIKYWRDENEVHHVPKRTLDELIL